MQNRLATSNAPFASSFGAGFRGAACKRISPGQKENAVGDPETKMPGIPFANHTFQRSLIGHVALK